MKEDPLIRPVRTPAATPVFEDELLFTLTSPGRFRYHGAFTVRGEMTTEEIADCITDELRRAENLSPIHGDELEIFACWGGDHTFERVTTEEDTAGGTTSVWEAREIE